MHIRTQMKINEPSSLEVAGRKMVRNEVEADHMDCLSSADGKNSELVDLLTEDWMFLIWSAPRAPTLDMTLAAMFTEALKFRTLSNWPRKGAWFAKCFYCLHSLICRDIVFVLGFNSVAFFPPGRMPRHCRCCKAWLLNIHL